MKSGHPVKNGVQGFLKLLETLDSGFRRNDEKGLFLTSHDSLITEQPKTIRKGKDHGYRTG